MIYPYTSSLTLGVHAIHNKGSVESSKLRITTWNCRGLHTGEPYLHHLAEGYSDVLAVTEHWLWPYEAHKLSTSLLAKHNVKNGFRDRLHNNYYYYVYLLYTTALDSVSLTHFNDLSLYILINPRCACNSQQRECGI